MKSILFLISSSILLLGSCYSEKKETAADIAASDSADVATSINIDSCAGGNYVKYAHVYNNLIVENQGNILASNLRFVKAVKQGATKERTNELFLQLVNQTETSISATDKSCGFNGNVDYRDAALALFEFYEHAWVDYKPLMEIKDKKDRVKILEDIKFKFNDEHAKIEQKLENEFMRSHNQFVYENDLNTRFLELQDQLDSMLVLN